jgi:hypothetical protein
MPPSENCIAVERFFRGSKHHVRHSDHLPSESKAPTRCCIETCWPGCKRTTRRLGDALRVAPGPVRRRAAACPARAAAEADIPTAAVPESTARVRSGRSSRWLQRGLPGRGRAFRPASARDDDASSCKAPSSRGGLARARGLANTLNCRAATIEKTLSSSMRCGRKILG